jgi:hypothetical protein
VLGVENNDFMSNGRKALNAYFLDSKRKGSENGGCKKWKALIADSSSIPRRMTQQSSSFEQWAPDFSSKSKYVVD